MENSPWLDDIINGTLVDDPDILLEYYKTKLLLIKGQQEAIKKSEIQRFVIRDKNNIDNGLLILNTKITKFDNDLNKTLKDTCVNELQLLINEINLRIHKLESEKENA